MLLYPTEEAGAGLEGDGAMIFAEIRHHAAAVRDNITAL